MKKLMIAAAMVCAAAMVQAATVDWSSGAIKMINPTIMAGGLTDGESYTANGPKIDNKAWTPAYGAAALDYAITFYWGEGQTDTVSDSLAAADFDSGAILSSITSNLFDEKPGTEYTFDIVLTTSAKDGAGNAFTLTSTQTGLAGTIQTAGDVKFNSGAPATWVASAAAVPEPTSAMLLLLGMAGLALRRRRA